MRTKWIIAAVAAVGLAFVTVWVSRPGEASGSAPAGACDPGAKPANLNFTVKDVDGKSVSLSSFKGKVVLLDFWATWCAPCQVEIPWFVEFQNKYKDRGFAVVGISVDDTPDQLKPFVSKFKMNYPVLVGLGEDALQEAYGPLWGLPTTYLIDRSGRLCRKHMGLVKKDDLEKQILGLL
jgi:cytochrome c biogenesis protein CcmG/thiol:disulfide interchange protein DsbE